MTLKKVFFQVETSIAVTIPKFAPCFNWPDRSCMKTYSEPQINWKELPLAIRPGHPKWREFGCVIRGTDRFLCVSQIWWFFSSSTFPPVSSSVRGFSSLWQQQFEPTANRPTTCFSLTHAPSLAQNKTERERKKRLFRIAFNCWALLLVSFEISGKKPRLLDT